MLNGDKQSKQSEETAKKTFEEKSTGSGLPLIKINQNQIDQTFNKKLISVRETFDQYNLISGLHSFMSVNEERYKRLLPPLVALSKKNKEELISKLETLKFNPLKKEVAA